MFLNELIHKVMNYRVDKVGVGEIVQLKGSVCSKSLETANIKYMQ